MPTETKIARWKIITGYAAFGVFAFILGLYLTFPYEVLKQRLLAEANGSGIFLQLKSLGPGFFGVTASGVEVSRKMEPNEEKAPPPLKIDSVAIRPSLYPLGVAVRAKLLRGVVSASVSAWGDKIRVTLDDLNLQDENLKAFSGVSLAGKANGSLSLDIPMVSPTKSQPAQPDFGQASGSLVLDCSGLQINGGTVSMYDLPKIVLGDLDGKVKFEKGLGTIDAFHIKSEELDLSVTGSLKLAKRLDFAEPNATLKFKAQPELTKRLGMIAGGFAVLPPDPQNPDYRMLRVQGYLGRPSSPDLRF